MSLNPSITLIIAVLGAVLGVVGTVLSILSFVRQLDRDKVKLRVGISFGIVLNASGPQHLVISVTNLSTFPVTLSEVGLRLFNSSEKLVSLGTATPDGKRPPLRMESRTAVSLWLPADALEHPRLRQVRSAYAKTDCGETAETGKGVFQRAVFGK